MIDESAAAVPFWIFLSVVLGFMIGDVCGDNFRHRKCLQQANEDLRDELEKARDNKDSLHQELKQQRGVINDIHKRVVDLSKLLNRPAAK